MLGDNLIKSHQVDFMSSQCSFQLSLRITCLKDVTKIIQHRFYNYFAVNLNNIMSLFNKCLHLVQSVEDAFSIF